MSEAVAVVVGDFDCGTLEAYFAQETEVGVFVESACYAACPGFHAFEDGVGGFSLHYDVGDGEPAAGLEDAEGFL
jgi:hypothetical protein